MTIFSLNLKDSRFGALIKAKSSMFVISASVIVNFVRQVNDIGVMSFKKIELSF